MLETIKTRSMPQELLLHVPMQRKPYGVTSELAAGGEVQPDAVLPGVRRERRLHLGGPVTGILWSSFGAMILPESRHRVFALVMRHLG